jgi:hypothetical protein
MSQENQIETEEELQVREDSIHHWDQETEAVVDSEEEAHLKEVHEYENDL